MVEGNSNQDETIYGASESPDKIWKEPLLPAEAYDMGEIARRIIFLSEGKEGKSYIGIVNSSDSPDCVLYCLQVLGEKHVSMRLFIKGDETNGNSLLQCAEEIRSGAIRPDQAGLRKLETIIYKRIKRPDGYYTHKVVHRVGGSLLGKHHVEAGVQFYLQHRHSRGWFGWICAVARPWHNRPSLNHAKERVIALGGLVEFAINQIA